MSKGDFCYGETKLLLVHLSFSLCQVGAHADPGVPPSLKKPMFCWFFQRASAAEIHHLFLVSLYGSPASPLPLLESLELPGTMSLMLCIQFFMKCYWFYLRNISWIGSFSVSTVSVTLIMSQNSCSSNLLFCIPKFFSSIVWCQVSF